MKIATPLSEVIEQYSDLFKQVDKRFINRTEEIEIIKMAILCRAHVLLEGKPGTGKSMLARCIFDLFDGTATEALVVYRKQFMANTQTEEVFGPVNMQLLKEKSVWKHNIEGMLPRSHFAFLDELYRASDSLLPSMMEILNERTFMNGTERVNCPLITAIGTTNFISDHPLLEAFHDRC